MFPNISCRKKINKIGGEKKGRKSPEFFSRINKIMAKNICFAFHSLTI